MKCLRVLCDLCGEKALGLPLLGFSRASRLLFAHMGSLALVAPFAFGGPIVEDRAEWVTVAIRLGVLWGS